MTLESPAPLPLSPTHLLGALYLLQEGVQLPGLRVEGAAHSLVVVGGLGGAGQVGGANLQEQEGKNEGREEDKVGGKDGAKKQKRRRE